MESMSKDTDKFCRRCGRKLKDENSKKLGYGKVCYAKIKKQNCEFLFEMEKENEV